MSEGQIVFAVPCWVTQKVAREALGEYGHLPVTVQNGVLTVGLDGQSVNKSKVEAKLSELRSPQYETVVRLPVVPDIESFVWGVVGELDVAFRVLPDGRAWFGGGDRQLVGQVAQEAVLQLGG